MSVSRHYRRVVGSRAAGAEELRNQALRLQGRYPPDAVREHTSHEGRRDLVGGLDRFDHPSMVIGAMDFACFSVSLAWLSGVSI